MPMVAPGLKCGCLCQAWHIFDSGVRVGPCLVPSSPRFWGCGDRPVSPLPALVCCEARPQPSGGVGSPSLPVQGVSARRVLTPFVFVSAVFGGADPHPQRDTSCPTAAGPRPVLVRLHTSSLGHPQPRVRLAPAHSGSAPRSPPGGTAPIPAGDRGRARGRL